MSIFLQNYVQILQGARVKPLPPVLPGGFDARSSSDGFVVQLSYLQIIIIAADAGADDRLLAADLPHRRSAGRSAPASRT